MFQCSVCLLLNELHIDYMCMLSLIADVCFVNKMAEKFRLAEQMKVKPPNPLNMQNRKQNWSPKSEMASLGVKEYADDFGKKCVYKICLCYHLLASLLRVS